MQVMESAATDVIGNALDPKPQSIGIDDLFPPPGHRYLSDDAIEKLRLVALEGAVTLSPLTVMGIVCDLRNMAADLEAESD
jgi:hypothetical protein